TTRKEGGSEIPEPFTGQIPEPSEFGEELDAGDLLSRDRRLWRLETYGDRYGNKRARHVLRFVPRPEPRIELGRVTEHIAGELAERPGRGRWKGSRVEADELRRVALTVAESFRRDQRLRRRGANLQQARRIDRDDGQRAGVQNPQDDAQWGKMPS